MENNEWIENLFDVAEGMHIQVTELIPQFDLKLEYFNVWNNGWMPVAPEFVTMVMAMAEEEKARHAHEAERLETAIENKKKAIIAWVYAKERIKNELATYVMNNPKALKGVVIRKSNEKASEHYQNKIYEFIKNKTKPVIKSDLLRAFPRIKSQPMSIYLQVLIEQGKLKETKQETMPGQLGRPAVFYEAIQEKSE